MAKKTAAEKSIEVKKAKTREVMIQNELSQTLGIPTGNAKQHFEDLDKETQEKVATLCEECQNSPNLGEARQALRNLVIKSRARAIAKAAKEKTEKGKKK